jgi:hypothetical protein
MTATGQPTDWYDQLEPPDDDAHLEEFLEWRVHRIARGRARLDEIAAELTRMIQRYEEWADRVAAPVAAQVDADCHIVRALVEARLDADPKFPKTVHVPSGTVTARKGSTVVEVDDEAMFVSWAAEHAPGLVRTPPPDPKPDKAAIKTALADGEVVQFARLVERERTVTISTDVDDLEAGKVTA